MTKVVLDVVGTEDGMAIQQVSALLGVPAPTLRSWERRYGIPMTTRSEGGHRRYGEGELIQLRLMRDEIARGKRAADAARSVVLLLDQHNPALMWINRLLAAAAQDDAAAIRTVLDHSRDELGLAATFDDVLMPAMRRVGAWWESGRCDVGREHLTTETARGWIARLTALSPVVTSEPPILLACGPGDMHTLGLEALAALLADQGRGCRMLGARTSELTLVTAAVATSAAAVVVVSHLHTHRRAAAEAIRAVDRAGCPVFYAGNAFDFPSRRVRVPGTYLGENLSKATAIILHSLLAGAPSPQVPQQAA